MSVAVERGALREFERPTWQSTAQLATTGIGLAAGWILTYRAITVSWLLGAASSLVIAVFSVVYVQHHFPDTYWRRHAEWDYVEASLASSSRVALPRFLQWVTGNIGFHHIHHLAPRIPNYLLPRAQAACPQLQPGATLTLRSSARNLRTNLWDEAAGHFVTFAEAGF